MFLLPMVNIVYIVKMEDLLILFVKRWFIQITVEEYYYRLYIASQGLANAIVSQLGEGRSENQDYDFDFDFDFDDYDFDDYDNDNE